MAVITISRGSASSGLLLAQKLAERLDYKILSREDLVQEASRFGVSAENLKEALLKPLSFWDRFKHERRRYLAFIQAALCNHVQQDNLVYHGNAGHLLLRGATPVFCVRLIAPLPYRIDQLVRRQNMSREEAAAYIEKVDRQRRDWTHFLYGQDYLDPALYDLVINLKTLTVESAVEIVAAAVQRQEFKPTEKSRRAMADFLLASRVRVVLAADKETALAEVEVSASDGVVHLRGNCRSPAMVAAVLDVAGRVEGVRDVDRQELDALDPLV